MVTIAFIIKGKKNVDCCSLVKERQKEVEYLSVKFISSLFGVYCC